MAHRPDLPLDAAHPETAGDQYPVDAVEVAGRSLGGLAVVAGHPADVDAGIVGEPARPQRLGRRQVGVRQVDVLADQRDRDRLGRVVHPAQHLIPVGPVHVTERQPEPAHHVGVQALGMQHPGDVVDRRRVRGRHHGLLVDVAHQADLALQAAADRPVRAAHDRVGLDADAA